MMSNNVDCGLVEPAQYSLNLSSLYWTCPVCTEPAQCVLKLSCVYWTCPVCTEPALRLLTLPCVYWAVQSLLRLTSIYSTIHVCGTDECEVWAVLRANCTGVVNMGKGAASSTPEPVSNTYCAVKYYQRSDHILDIFYFWQPSGHKQFHLLSQTVWPLAQTV